MPVTIEKSLDHKAASAINRNTRTTTQQTFLPTHAAMAVEINTKGPGSKITAGASTCARATTRCPAGPPGRVERPCCVALFPGNVNHRRFSVQRQRVVRRPTMSTRSVPASEEGVSDGTPFPAADTEPGRSPSTAAHCPRWAQHLAGTGEKIAAMHCQFLRTRGIPRRRVLAFICIVSLPAGRVAP